MFKRLSLKVIPFSLFPILLNPRNQGILIILSEKMKQENIMLTACYTTEEQETMALICVLHSDLIFKAAVFWQDTCPAAEEIATLLPVGVRGLNT